MFVWSCEGWVMIGREGRRGEKVARNSTPALSNKRTERPKRLCGGQNSENHFTNVKSFGDHVRRSNPSKQIAASVFNRNTFWLTKIFFLVQLTTRRAQTQNAISILWCRNEREEIHIFSRRSRILFYWNHSERRIFPVPLQFPVKVRQGD